MTVKVIPCKTNLPCYSVMKMLVTYFAFTPVDKEYGINILKIEE